MPAGLYDNQPSRFVNVARQNAIRKKLEKKNQHREPEYRPVISMTYGVATRYHVKTDQAVCKYKGSSANRKKLTADEQLQKIESIKKNAESGIFPVCRSCKKYRATSEILKILPLAAFLQKVPDGRRCNCARGDLRKKISDRTRGKLRDKFAAFYDQYGKNSTFATFTFINKISDTDAVALLNKFLTVLRKEKKNLQYIWVAERQQRNGGRIHFHCLINKYLDVERYNALWVLQQYQSGLIGFSRKQKMYIDRRTIEVAYVNRNVQQFFNAFDIKKVWGMDGLGAYLTKYVTKNRDTFGCAAWHCSREVSRSNTGLLIPEDIFNELQSEKNISVNKKTGEVYEAKLIVTDYCNMVFLLNKKYFHKYLDEIRTVNKWIFDREYIPERSDYEMTVQGYYDTIFTPVENFDLN